jgi:hypothetical protein
MTYATKTATAITNGDTILIDGNTYTVLGQPIVSKHSPGRVGYTLRGTDGRCYRYSITDTDRMEIQS